MPDFAVRSVLSAVDKFSTILSHMGVNMGKFGTASEGAWGKAEKGAASFKAVFGGVLGERLFEKAAEGVKKLVEAVPEFAARGQEIGRMASIIGVSADAWQRFSYAAKLTDTNVEGLQTGLQRLNRNMADLSVGKGTLMDLVRFGPPGLARQIRSTHDASEAFLILADSISKTRDPQVRARIAVAAFGKAGQDLLPMLAQGREGIHKLMQEASIYGSVLDDKTIEASARFDDSLKRLKGSVQSVKDTVLSFVLRAAQPYIEKALAWVAANKEIIAQRVENAIMNIASAIQAAKPFLLFLWNAAGWLIKNWPLLALVYVYWTAAQIALNVALDSNPIGAVIIGIEALAAAVLIIIHYWHDITDALNAAWNWFDRLYNKSLALRTAIFFLASPIWLVVEAVRTLVDLLSGRGLKSFENFIPPWLKGATDKLGLTQQNANQGYWNNAEAPNKGAPSMRVVNNINVDNSRAPGTTSNVRVAPALSGAQGMQYAMGGG